MVMATGRVIRFDEVKGYGFIAPSDGGEDVFLHANELSDRGLLVSAGTQVEFRVVEGDRGFKAYEVRVIGDQQSAQTASVEAADDPAPRNGSRPAEHEPEERAPAEDELFEVFPEREFFHQITDLLLTAAPQVTGSTIVELRGCLVQFARKNGWVE
jgi:cold shock protein